jgi:dephospho-CoA kinase
MPAARKRERADFVIENDGDEAGLRREATRVWQALAARAAAGR